MNMSNNISSRTRLHLSGNYKTSQTYSYDDLYQLIKVNGETTYNPYQSSVPEFKSTYTQIFEFDSDGLGNMIGKVSSETVNPSVSIGDNLNYSFGYVYDTKYAHRLINVDNRYYKYDSNGNVICEQEGKFDGEEPETYHKINTEAEGVYSTDYGWGLYREKSGGKSSSSNKYRREYTWDERNLLIGSVDPGHTTSYIYGQDGQRSNKYTSSSETLYFNKMWTLHTDSGNAAEGGQFAKNIYLGDTRIVTKLSSPTETTIHEEYFKQYYYHSDHLGSASLITDYDGYEYQRIEYTPYGETWVEKFAPKSEHLANLNFLPYKFTGKEMDEETGLYYYGARYLDPKYSRWLSTDPALSSYVEKNYKGPSGGIYNSVNLNLYHYGGNNPIKYVDPDGREPASSHIGLGLKVLTVNPDKMNRDQARAWVMDNIMSDDSIPICQRIYSMGMLGYTGVFDFTGDKLFTSKLAAADCRANNNTISQVIEGKIRPDSNELGEFAFDYTKDTDLFGAFGGGNGYTWNVESFDKNTNTAKVRIYFEDTFDFNEGHGKRPKIAEKLTTLGRKAGMSSFKVTGYYYLEVNVGDEAAKKIQEALKNVE